MAAAEPDLIQALRYGMGKGHRSTLTALKRATQDGKLASHHVEQIEKLSTSSPMFSALVGHTDEGEGLGAYEGTTLIKVGDQELNLPDPGTPASGLIQRVNLALVRNIVFASAMALNKRKGVLRLDEAWVFTSSSPKELERLGRLARSQTIDVQLYTQRISDALDANLQNYLTRGAFDDGQDPTFGKVIAPGLYGPNHQHFFAVRLDMNVDGPANKLYELQAEAASSEENPWGNAWYESKTQLKTESEAQSLADPVRGRSWVVTYAEEKNSLGGEVGYKLELGGTLALPLSQPRLPAARPQRLSPQAPVGHPVRRAGALCGRRIRPAEPGVGRSSRLYAEEPVHRRRGPGPVAYPLRSPRGPPGGLAGHAGGHRRPAPEALRILRRQPHAGPPRGEGRGLLPHRLRRGRHRRILPLRQEQR